MLIGMIIFPLNVAPFQDLGPDGISMFFVSCIVSQLVISLGGSAFKGGNGSMMIEVVPFLHIMYVFYPPFLYSIVLLLHSLTFAFHRVVILLLSFSLPMGKRKKGVVDPKHVSLSFLAFSEKSKEEKKRSPW